MKYIHKIRDFFFLFFAALTLAGGCAAEIRAQGGVSIYPNVAEITVAAGKEKTFALTSAYKLDKPEYAAFLKNTRVVARLSDWQAEASGSIKTAKTGTLERSAAPWVIYSPAEFTLTPGSVQLLRFTVSVPKETAPGDYYFAVYIEDRDPPPPKEADKKINVRLRIYSLIYVQVPGLTRDGEITGLKAQMTDGIPTVISTFKNTGNSFITPRHAIEVRDQADKLVAEVPMKATRRINGNTEMDVKTALPETLEAGIYKVIYKADAGNNKPIFVARTTLAVSPSEALQAKTRAERSNPDLTKNSPPPVEEKAAPKAAGSAAQTDAPEKPVAAGKSDSALKDAPNAPTQIAPAATVNAAQSLKENSPKP